jgi:tetratricopeptide (TPR) repeat protein
MSASAKIFLSTVSDEFRTYRDQLRSDLTRPNVEVKVQEDFKDQGRGTLDELDIYIAGCDAVVHLAGDMTGSAPGEPALRALRAKYPDLADKLPPLGEALQSGTEVSYTQWEAWLALYHNKLLFIAKAAETAERGPKYMATDASRAAQAAHIERLKAMDRYPGCTFASPDNLIKYVLSSPILELLARAQVVTFAEEAGGARDLAEGFINEMARRVAGDKALNFEGQKQAVRNAIEIYEKEIAGRAAETNFDAIVDMALAKAKAQVDRGQSALARATLDKAADDMAREEEERRERYVAGVTLLRQRERDIALAAYDGDAAADAILKLARSIHGANVAAVVEFLGKEAEALCEYGTDRGSNVHLVAEIALRRERLALAVSEDERGSARHSLGIALLTLGERERGTARLEEAVAAYRATLYERTHERVPLAWGATQNNLGLALSALGERERGTARLEEAVAAYRAAQEEWTRERVPLDWARTHHNLGNALQTLGARESGTARLEETVAAYRAALEERTRERVPLDWAMTQSSLGGALGTLGQRESGPTRLVEAVGAYRAALEELTRERVPLLQWAGTQVGLANALRALGERENCAKHLEEAVAAYRAALGELTRERVPLQWAGTQNNLGNALKALGERESDPARLEEAVAAHRAALQERMRERIPLDWAQTQNNLAIALAILGKPETAMAHLEEAVAAWNRCLEITIGVWPSEWLRWVEIRRDETMTEIARRSAN